MANTYTLISSNVLGSAAANVTFSAIPSTYTDLVLRWSGRGTNAAIFHTVFYTYNSSAAGYSDTYLLNIAGTPISSSDATPRIYGIIGYDPASTATANTFGSGELYIPNYNSSTNKPNSSFSAPENNSATSTRFTFVGANLWSNTAAISSLTISCTTSFDTGSSFYLYGIKNS
jgi:hypothetical protein